MVYLKLQIMNQGFKGGWRISSANNGSAEFEQVTIRGTLKTAVFEKESVNAVGGQLYIANSTTITGSNDVGVDDTTIQVANASGFAAGEIITAKKVTATGFGTEYMLVQSAAREDSSSDSNFSGSVVVVRQYGLVSASGSGASGSLGGTPAAKQTYGPGQVIVSTGKLNTGYIRLNANPNDISTPYMDIVERTGSGVYDVDLKVRLGDLSGLSSALVGGSPGFGLFTDRAFLTNDVTVGTLGTEHIVIDSTSVRFKNNTTTMAELRGTTWTIGGAHGATDDVIVLSPGGGVAIQDSATDKVTITSSGITLKENNVDTIQLSGGAVIVGEVGVGKSNVQITSGAINLRNNTTNKMVLAADGTITIGSNVSIDASGAASFNGLITGGSLSIGTGNAIFRVDTDGDMWVGHATQGSAPIQLYAATGQVTASKLLLTSGAGTDGSQVRFGTGGKFQVTGSTGQFTASLGLIKYNDDNYLQVKAGGIDLKSETFNLATSTVIMSSAGAGSLTMGSTPPTASGGDGILLSGSGHF